MNQRVVFDTDDLPDTREPERIGAALIVQIRFGVRTWIKPFRYVDFFRGRPRDAAALPAAKR